MDILVPSDIKTVEFPIMVAPRISVDDPAAFPTIARILDAMLKLVDPKNQVLMQYLDLIDSSTPTRVFPQKRAKGSSKASKAPKLQRRRRKLKDNQLWRRKL